MWKGLIGWSFACEHMSRGMNYVVIRGLRIVREVVLVLVFCDWWCVMCLIGDVRSVSGTVSEKYGER